MSNFNNISSPWLEMELHCKQVYGYSIQEVEKRLFFGSYVGDNLNYVFVATPKAACSTMKWILVDLENRHVALKHYGKQSRREMIIHARNHSIKNLMQVTDAERVKLLTDKNAVRFCVVRNPYARFVSAWADKIRQKEPNFGNVWKSIADYFDTDPKLCPTFAQFARWVVETQQAEYCNNHWRSMSHLLLPDLLRYTHVLHTENLEVELDAVLKIIAPSRNAAELLKKHRINESLPIDWQSCYDEETAKLVAKFYQEDFKRFAYPSDSWKNKYHTRSLSEEIIALHDRLAKYETAALDAIRARNDVIFELTQKKPSSVGIPKLADKTDILVLGDSHARIFKHEAWLKLTPNLTWKTILVQGATVSGLKNPNSKTQAAKFFKQALVQNPAKTIMFCLGEVDTGFVIWLKAEKQGIDVQKAAQQAVENYCELIELASRQAQVVVLSTPLPTLKDGLEEGAVAKARSSIKTSQRQRTELTCWFNTEMELWCKNHAINYVNLDPVSKGPDGQLDPKLLHINPRDHHYNPNYYQKLLAKHLLPVIKESIGK